MRFMIMHKNDPSTEAGNPPPRKLVDEMGAFIGGHAQAGRLIDGAGLAGSGVLVRAHRLQPSAKAKRLTFLRNDLHVTDGPFAESKELLGGFAVLELSGMDEAIALCRPYAAILGGTLEIDVRQVAADPV